MYEPYDPWWWIWYWIHYHRPPPPPPPDGWYMKVQIAVDPELRERAFEKGWILVAQLGKGQIVVEKEFTKPEVFEAGMAKMKITFDGVMAQGMKQLQENATKALG